MLRPRVIPCLLLSKKGLVKTLKFSESRYIGDPLNTVRIFNEKEVDELIFIDIDASVEKRGPDFDLIEKIASACRMPFCYGGGISSVAEAKKLISLGVEKIALSSSAIASPELVSEIAKEVGSQSVVVVLDVKKRVFGYEVMTLNGRKGSGKSPLELASKFEKLGAGELLINSIDNDGVMGGYDLKLLKLIREEISIPMTVLGGAGSLDHMKKVVDTIGISGLGAGSFFVFKGEYKAVLISYPDFEKREMLT